MLRRNLKLIGVISIIASSFTFNACTPQEQIFASGVGVGAVAASVFNYPHYYDRPYYYYSGRYYYGGIYRDGYYIYRGQRLSNGHYYHDGYRYHNRNRYRARVGNHGYYQSREQYDNYQRRGRYDDRRDYRR